MNGLIRLILAVVVISSVFGCRKEIIHEEGITYLPKKQAEKDTTVLEGAWSFVPNSPKNISSIEEFEGVMYLGGKDEATGDAYLWNFNGDFKVAAKGEFISDDISDMIIYNNQLWIGGSFAYYDMENLKSYDNILIVKDGEIGGMDFGDFLSSSIYGFELFNNDLMVFGKFKTGQEKIKTNYVERIANGNVIGFHDGIDDIVRDGTVYNNSFYVTGESDFAPNVHLCGYWNGSSWANSGFFSKSSIIEYGRSVQSYENELYFAHNKTWATNAAKLMKYDGKDYSDILEVDFSEYKNCSLKVMEGKLFLFSEGVQLNGEVISNIIVYDGTEWKPVGSLLVPISDICYYKQELYAATKIGLYKYE